MDKKKKKNDNHCLLLIVLSLVISMAFYAAGDIVNDYYDGIIGKKVPLVLPIILSCLPIIMIITCVIVNTVRIKKLREGKIKGVLELLLEHREKAEEIAENSMRELKTIRIKSYVYAVLYLIFGISSVFLFGPHLYKGTIYELPAFCCSFLIGLGLVRLLPVDTNKTFENDVDCIRTESDCPKIYSLARKAAKELGCNKDIVIALNDDDRTFIVVTKKKVYLFLGVILLCTLSEKEMYEVMLHEFSHAVNESGKKEKAHKEKINYYSLSFVYPLAEKAYCSFDEEFLFKFSVLDFALSVKTEFEADRAMVKYGDKAAAASMLLKLFYYQMYEWERFSYDEPHFGGKPVNDYVSSEIQLFLERKKLRKDVWKGYVYKEILAKTASHPTVRMRLEALGVTEAEELDDDSGPEYDAERKKALKYIDERMAEIQKNNSEFLNKEYYDEPLKTVNDWEAAGKPVTAEGYRDVVQALHTLQRISEAEELCGRAIKELPSPSTAYACLTKGVYLLKRGDESGMPLVYRAIEENDNAVDPGLDAIGAFCCITGDQSGLDAYREKAMELIGTAEDRSELSVLKKGDDLSKETLPKGVLDGILDHIKNSDTGSIIEEVYLVHKRISDDFSTSVFVIKMKIDADPEEKSGLLHKVFNYLDAAEAQYSLFDYSEVSKAGVEKIEGSLVYERKE